MRLFGRLLGAITAAALLTGCAHRAPLTPTIIGDPTAAAQSSNTAPVTFTHAPTPPASARSANSSSRPTAGSGPPGTRSGRTSGVSALSSTGASSRPGTSDGAPPQRDIVDPDYTVDSINRKVPEQVAWAYLTRRMSYSYKDSGPEQHSRQAATYASPIGQPPPATVAAAAANWTTVVRDQMQAAVTITEMNVYPPGPANTAAARQALVRVTWNRTLSSELNAPVQTSGSTTMTLQRQANSTWLMTDDGFAAPN